MEACVVLCVLVSTHALLRAAAATDQLYPVPEARARSLAPTYVTGGWGYMHPMSACA